MYSITDRQGDDAIRAALLDANEKGKLAVVAAVTGIAGGAARLEEIINTTEELSLLERGTLMSHLEVDEVSDRYDMPAAECSVAQAEPSDVGPGYEEE